MGKARSHWVAMGLLAALLATPALAHHSVAGVFDVGRTVRFAGTVSRVDWINPHTYIYVDVTEADGKVTVWKLESLPVAMMRKAGLSRQDILANGQRVEVVANPARNGTQALGYIVNLRYADGRNFQFGRDPGDKSAAAE